MRSAFYARQPMFVLLYKESCLNTNEFDLSLPSVVKSLLQEFDDVFTNDIPSGLPPLRGIEHQFLIDQLIGVIPRKRRSSKGKLNNFWQRDM